MKKLQELHDSEINFSISSFFDGMVTCKIGDEMNGYVSVFMMDTIEGAVDEICKEAMKLYPDSLFTKSNKEKDEGFPKEFCDVITEFTKRK